MPVQPAVAIAAVVHRYGERIALDDVALSVSAGEVFGLLGPNGGGKTTLFRILATLLPLQQGTVCIEGVDVRQDPAAIRRLIGITFQSPSLDAKLTVRENLACHGMLYGLAGRELSSRIEARSGELGIAERLNDRVETLSGGLKRRVEIAKSLLHEPRLLLLDEPSTGLDPGIRHNLWQTLQSLSASRGLTILVSTHLLEEAEHCDRLAILDRGRLVAEGTPDALKHEVGGDCVTIAADDPNLLADELRSALDLDVQRVGGQLRVERPDGHELVREIMLRFGGRVRSITLGRPTLEDVFIHKTGRRLDDEEPAGK